MPQVSGRTLGGQVKVAALLPEAQADLLNRRPAWAALSELFLDTSFDSGDRDRIASILASSSYSLADLEHILLWEVYPACRQNLLWIAGEWLAFDPEWLQSRILRGPSRIVRLWTATLGRVSVHSSLEWRGIKRRVAVRRGKDPRATVP